MIRDVALLLAALGYVLELFVKQPIAPETQPFAEGMADGDPTALDDEDVRYLASIAYQVNERVIDEIKGWDAFNGVLLGTIFAIFLLLVDKVDSFTWWPILALTIPTALTTWNLSGRVLYSPRPREFGESFVDDPHDAVLNLIEDHNNDIEQNYRLRSRKRTAFWSAFGILVAVCLVAAACKEYTIVRSDDAKTAIDHGQEGEADKARRASRGSAVVPGTQKTNKAQLRSRAGASGGDGRAPSYHHTPGPGAQAPHELQL